jgi:hypothetical protein
MTLKDAMADTVTPDDPLNIARPTPKRVPWHTRWFLLAFYALAIVNGIRNIYFWLPSGLDVLVPVLVAICLGWWATTDARRRKHPIPPLSKIWFYVLAVFLVPGYVMWSRGWRGLGWVVLNAVAWYALATVTMHAGGEALRGAEWWRAMGAL